MLGQFLEGAISRMAGAGVSEPRCKVEFLLAHVLQCGRLELWGRRDRLLTAEQAATAEALLARLVDGEPLQYVLGETDFLGRVFRTDRRALIPRPETEGLVEAVLGCTGVWGREGVTIADVGTGSGCIAVSLALARPECRVVATDLSADALDLARENARAHGVLERIEFRRGDLLAGQADESLDAVVSNPPYVSTSVWRKLPADIRDREPRSALDGGESGLEVIARLIPQAKSALKRGGTLFMEIGEDQGESVRNLLIENTLHSVEIRKDLAGHDRIAWGQRP